MENDSGSTYDTRIQRHSSNNTIRWRKPALGGVKCNVDASIFKDQGCYGVGMCLRGENGKYISTKTAWFHGIPQPQEAEACSLKEAIIWLGNRGLTAVSIKLDCKQVVEDISNQIGANSELVAIINFCKASLSRLPNFKISFIQRQANNVAHLLARASLSYARSQCHDHMPSCIEFDIMNEMS